MTKESNGRVKAGLGGGHLLSGLAIVLIVALLATSAILTWIGGSESIAELAVSATTIQQLAKSIKDDPAPTANAMRIQSARNILGRISNQVNSRRVDASAQATLNHDLANLDSAMEALSSATFVDASTTMSAATDAMSRADKLHESLEAAARSLRSKNEAADLLRICIWPLIVSAVLSYLLLTPEGADRLKRLLRLFRRFKLFGQEFELGDAAAHAAQGVLADLREQAIEVCDAVVTKYDVQNRLTAAMEAISKELNLNVEKDGVRATVHIPDILIADYLYQLLNYWPDPRGKGRPFSVRFGIIGRAWRSAKHQYAPSVPSGSPASLIENWGMTSDEAHMVGQNSTSFLALLLRDKPANAPGAKALGILYMDSRTTKAFGESETAAPFETLERACKESGLTSALTSAIQELRRTTTPIRIQES